MILRARSGQVTRIWMPVCVCATRSAANSLRTWSLRIAGSMATRPAIRVSWEKQHATTVSYLGFDSGSETLAPCYRVKVRDGSILKMGDEKNNFTPLIGRPLAVDHTSLSASQTEPEFIARPSHHGPLSNMVSKLLMRSRLTDSGLGKSPISKLNPATTGMLLLSRQTIAALD